MEDELLPLPPPKKLSNKVEEDLLPPPPKKKLAEVPSFSTSLQDAIKPVQKPLEKASPLASNLKSQSEAKEKKAFNPFTASIEEIKSVYGEDYSKEKQLNRQKNYSKGLDKAAKSFVEKMPLYEQGVAELEDMDSQLESLKSDPNQYNQAVQVRNQKAKELISIADQLKAEKVKADIYEKGLGAVDILRRKNEDTTENSIDYGLNQLGVMALTTLPAMARGAKLVKSYIESKSMGLSPEEEQAYIEAQGLIAKKDWKGLTDVAKGIYEKNQILEGGFGKESGFENIKKGDYKEAGTQLGKELLRNLPVTLGIGLSFANPLIGATYTIGGTAGSEMLDMDINNPQMSEQAKVANAFIKGGSEYVTEKVFGTFNYLGRIAGGTLKSKEGKKVVMGTVKSAYDEVVKRLGVSADIAEEVSSEMLNKLVGDYTDYVTGKTSEVDFTKGLGETVTTAISTSLLLGGAGRAAKYGVKKIDELRAKAKVLEQTIQDPSIKPEIAEAVKEQIANTNSEIGNEAVKAKELYDAMPVEKQDKIDLLVEEKTNAESLLSDPELPLETKPFVEEKIVGLQSEIDNEYKNVDKKLIETEDQKLEQIVSESEKENPIEEIKTIADAAPVSDNGSEVPTPYNIINERTISQTDIPTSDKGTQGAEPIVETSVTEGKAEPKEETVNKVVEKPLEEQKVDNKVKVDNILTLLEAERIKEEPKVSERKRQIELLDTEKKIAQLEREVRKAPIRGNKKQLSQRQLRIQISNYKEQLRDLKGLKPRKKIKDSVLRITKRNFTNTVKEENLNFDERLILSAIGNLAANDKDIAKLDGNSKLRKQGVLLKEGGLSIDEVVTDFISENELDADMAQEFRNTLIDFVNQGDAYDWMTKIKEREAEIDPDTIREDELYDYAYSAAIENDLTDEEINEIELELIKYNELTQQEYGNIRNQFAESYNGTEKGVSGLENKTDTSKEKDEARKSVLEEKLREAKNAYQLAQNKLSKAKQAAEKVGQEQQVNIFGGKPSDALLFETDLRSLNNKVKELQLEVDKNKQALDKAQIKLNDFVPSNQVQLTVESVIDKLESLKIDPKNKLLSVVPPFNLIPLVWNGSITVLQTSIKAGKAVKDAIQDAINYINSKNPKNFDENAFRKYFNEKLGVEEKIKKPKAIADLNEEVVKAAEQILNSEFESNGNLSKSATIRTQKRNTAAKQVKSDLGAKEEAALETVITNYDKIRDVLFKKELISKIDCKW